MLQHLQCESTLGIVVHSKKCSHFPPSWHVFDTAVNDFGVGVSKGWPQLLNRSQNYSN